MIDTLKIHLDRIDAVVAEYNAPDRLAERAYAAQEAYHAAKAALYLVCRDADRLSSKMIRDAEDVLHRAQAAHREACAAIDADDAAKKKAHYWGERVEAGKRLECAKREYDNACAAYDDYMNDDDY